jgi:(p)ppGpp synthase/HD superfamily hydrolase
MPKLEDAISLAVTAHQGQVDKAGQPYILHPLRVMFRLDTEEERMVGVLHDVLEDTPHTAADLTRLGYSAAVIDALVALARRANESYEAFIERVAENPLAVRVKLADLADNLDVTRLTEVDDRSAQRLTRYLRARTRLRASTGG